MTWSAQPKPVGTPEPSEIKHTASTEPTALVVETIRDEERLRALEPEWVVLENETGNTLPFRTAAWALSWWKHLRRQCSVIQDSLALRAIRTPSGRLVGVAPLMITQSPGRGFLRMQCLQFFGADPNITELRGGLWARDYEQACIRALTADAARHASEWDWLVWNGIPAGSATAETLKSGVKWTRFTPYYTLRLEGDWAKFKSGLRRNVKESLRKCYNSLKRDGLACSLEMVTERDELAGALQHFFWLHAERSTTGSIKHPNVFATSNARAFLIDACERLGQRGQARVYRLRVGRDIVATRVAFLMGGTLYLYFSGYRREFGKYSVTTTLLAEIIQHAFAEGIGSINLSTGNDVSKTRWAPRESLECDGVTVSSRLRGRLAYATYRFLETTMLSQDRRSQITQALSRNRWRSAHAKVAGDGGIAQADVLGGSVI